MKLLLQSACESEEQEQREWPKHVSRQWLTPHDDSPLARQSSAEGYTEHLRHDDAGGGGDGAAEQMKYDPPPGAGLATQLAGRHMKP